MQPDKLNRFIVKKIDYKSKIKGIEQFPQTRIFKYLYRCRPTMEYVRSHNLSLKCQRLHQEMAKKWGVECLEGNIFLDCKYNPSILLL